jgi:flagellar protein FlaI
VNRLENPPINVPRQMIQALDIMCIQNQVRITDPETGESERVRRNETIEELAEVTPEQINVGQIFYRDAEYDEFRSRLGESRVLDEIRKEQGWQQSELNQELDNRRQVLEYLLENDIRGVRDVTRTIQAYMLNPDEVLRKIQEDSLDPSAFRDVTDVEYVIERAADPDTVPVPNVSPEELEQEVDVSGGEPTFPEQGGENNGE